jgi:hypothetical protein
LAVQRAPWLEPHDRFEGVGAHELNPRYSHVDGGGFDEQLTVSRRTLPALVKAQRRLTLTRPLVRLLGLVPQLDGMDGAHYQFDHGKPDLRVMRDAGLWWIGWKVSQSTGYVDPTFAQIREEWLDFECRFPYHWLSSTTDPIAQADWYLKQLNELRPGEAVMLDIEEAGDTVDKALAFFERTEEYTHRPGVGYSGIYVAGGTIWKSPELRMSRYGRRPFTVAAYVTEANLRARLAATHSPDPDAWQYSSNGPVPGIVGRCDMDMVFDKPAFQLACGSIATPTPHPLPEDDMIELRSNKEDRVNQYGGVEKAGEMIFAIGDFKRNISAKERDERFPNVPLSSPLSNAVLDTIPDASSGGTVDATARAAVAQLNDAVGRTGQVIGDMQKGLGAAAEARA